MGKLRLRKKKAVLNFSIENSSPSAAAVFGLVLLLALFAGINDACCASFWNTLPQSETRKAIPLTNETVTVLAERLKPAVVNISVTQVVTTGGIPKEFQSPFGKDDQFNEFWKRFFGNQEPRELKKKSLGSGFIINRDGYIVTNNHVVQKAKDITVILNNKKQYPAKVIGTDPKTDIALIKIDAAEALPVAPLGDSDKLKEGDAVLAIGNPFGLSETVTSGIVSAKGRVIGAGPYDDFIQTDASINPGNSGGPLINYYGEVIGINTAIVAAGQGIGFAVPVNLIKDVLVQLKEKSRVTRGWLGVIVQAVTPDLAESFGLKAEGGAIISDITSEGPAEKAGLKRGDVILSLNGKVIRDYHELPRMVASMPPGDKAVFKLLRDGKEETISAEIGLLKEEGEMQPSQEVRIHEQLGMTLQSVTPEIAKELKMKKAEGVVVTNVEAAGLAGEAGIQRGDVILEINRKPVKNAEESKEIILSAKRTLLFLIYRNGITSYVPVSLPANDK